MQPGRFDRRVLDQGTHWVTGQSEVVRVQDMCFAHLHNVLAMLTAQATRPHFQAMVDVLLDPSGHTAAAEVAVYELTGQALHTATADRWLETTPLVHAIRRELARRAPR